MISGESSFWPDPGGLLSPRVRQTVRLWAWAGGWSSPWPGTPHSLWGRKAALGAGGHLPSREFWVQMGRSLHTEKPGGWEEFGNGEQGMGGKQRPWCRLGAQSPLGHRLGKGRLTKEPGRGGLTSGSCWLLAACRCLWRAVLAAEALGSPGALAYFVPGGGPHPITG